MADERERLRASAHPVRLRILSLLTGAELSATDVARELDLTHANASYHLRVLAKAGLIVEAGEERVRGGLVKRYRHPWEDDVDHACEGAKPIVDAQQFRAAMAEELVRRGRLARPGVPGYAVDAELWVAPEAWERVRELLGEAGALIHREARPPRTPGTRHVNLTVSAFEMADGSEADG
jgi:DNA-binding transcriptional ArsR family regulator